MNILVAYYSRTGQTEKLAEVLIAELKSRGHVIVVERIEAKKRRSKWTILAQQSYTYPLIFLAMLSRPIKDWWIRHYRQVEEDIQPLSCPDVSAHDVICIGGPKWAEISYPVARYLREVKGLAGKKVATFGTFAGPPLPVFELELLFRPMGDRVGQLGGQVVTSLGLSSGYHELYVLPLMKLASRIRFKKPLRTFHIESAYGQEKIREFCNAIES